MTNEVELVTIGDELLLGFTVDTNSAFLSQRLAEQGIGVARRTTVGDSRDAIADAVREALHRTGAVITTGGLGPTSDDLTMESVALAFGVALELDRAHLDWMRDRWKQRFERDLPESNRRQAMLPRGARKLMNHHGSAPGAYIADDRERWAVVLPGVPREMRGMTHDALLPLLREKGWGAGECITSLTLRTTGTPESLLQDQLSGVVLSAGSSPLARLSLAYLPGVDGVDLRLTVRGHDSSAAAAALDHAAAAIRAAIAGCIYAEGDDDLARVLLAACRARDWRIAVAESCTGGLLGARLTAIPGSSDVFVGGVIAYDDAVKVRELDVAEAMLREHGAVSEPVVRQMALGARRRFRADAALAITGVAGPGGGTPAKPVGTVWICVAAGERVEARQIHSWGDRQEVRYRAAQAAMDTARRLLA
ncbi:MAG: competence/damage-inducible protein A [Gemmatimonadaceae bacterium]